MIKISNNGNKFQQYIQEKMSIHRVRLNGGPTNNLSFSHQQSISQQGEMKHKKKICLGQKLSCTPNCHRIKTDEKDSSIILKNQQLKSRAGSIHLVHSASKLSKVQQKLNPLERKKSKKSKKTISVINLTKKIEESKVKGSSTVTKRKKSGVDFSEKLKEKLQDFKILSACLEQYVREQRRSHNEANLNEIIKIISAFNRSQIAPISQPLQKLIGQIVNSIKNSIPKSQHKPILKKSISFCSRNDIQQEDTVKKGIANRELLKSKQQNGGDVKRLEQNLNRLKYQSNRLKYFLDQVSYKGIQQKYKGERVPQGSKSSKQKVQQLNQLKQIASQQARIIQQLEENSDQNDTFRSQSSN